jgi:uncharacterized membrane protein YoaK (UPF0700 family)
VINYSADVKVFAVFLAALAGYVDALGFLKLGGFFVSFMSGNSTRLAVGLAEASIHAAIAGALVLTFVLGVVIGSVTGRLARSRRRAAVLILVGGLLAIAAALSALGTVPLAVGLMTLAMGAENAVFEEKGEVRIGLTYMTGALVRVGQGIGSALFGDDRRGWIPFLLLWFGLVAGGVAGALAYTHLGLGGLWIAAAAALALAGASTTLKS